MADERTGNFSKSQSGALYEQIHENAKKVKNLAKEAKLKSKICFDTAFWESSAKLAKANSEKIDLGRSVKLRELREKKEIEEWDNSDEAARFRKSQMLYQAEEKSCMQQAENLKVREESDGKKRRVWLSLFTTSSKGLKIMGTGEGRRSTSDRSNFRQALIHTYELRHPNEETALWDVVLGEYIPNSDTAAAYLYSHSFGPDLMDEMFGEGAQKDMFEPCNGLVLYTPIKQKMDQGLFVIVPDVGDNPSTLELQRWHSAQPKEFKIRLMVDNTHKDLDKKIRFPNPTTWRDLEGRRLHFPKNCNFRPKSRYLYYLYCSAVLRRSYNEAPRCQTLKKELGKFYWGARGKYMCGAMLKALVEELGGKGWEALMRGSIEDPSTITHSDPTFVQLQIAKAKKEVEEQRGEGVDSKNEDA